MEVDMNTLLIVIGINAAVWTMIVVGWRFQRTRIEQQLSEDVSRTGEHLVLGPQNGYYAKSKGIMAVKSMGVMALTNKRLIFRVMFGKGFDIPIEDIVGISGNVWFQGMYRNGQEFMILKLRDDSEIGFQTKDHRAWMDQIGAAVKS